MALDNNQHAYHDAMTPKGRFRHGWFLDYVIAALIVLTVFIQGTYTIRQIGICWDEPSQYHIAKGYVEWLRNVDKDASFSSETLERTFGFKPHYNDHPTLSKIISATTYALLRNLMGDFWAYRVSAPLLFGILLAVLYLRLAHAQSRLSGLAAALCLAMMPRMFTHGHIGVTDAPLCLFWFLAIWAFEKSCDRPWFSPLAGVAFGLCMSVKFTGILLPIPLIIWGSIYRRRSMLAPTACLLIGIPIFLLLNPSMWDHPVKEFWAFLQMSTTRVAWNAHWMVFLGRIYEFSPPWFYAPFMVFVTIPEITAALFATGFGMAVCNRLRNSISGSAIIHFLFLIIITMHPNAPIFNGVRLFLPAFVFVAVIAGMGCDRVARWVTQYVQQRRPALVPKKASQWITAVTVALLLITSATPLMGIYPYGLEYYNAFVGRIKGARKLGLETTYWWTVVNKDALSRLNKILPKDSSIQFIPTEPDLYNLYKEVGLLRKDITIVDNFDCDYLLLLCWPYWNFPGYFMAKLGVPQWQMRVIDFLAVDDVPFWILYENPRR